MKKLMGLISIVLALGLLFPFVRNYVVEETIQGQKVILKDYGLDVDIYSTKGYFTSQRFFTLQINNGRYFANSIYKILLKKYPEQKNTLEKFFYDKGIDWELFFSGMSFEGDLLVDNYYINKPIIHLHLKQLSTQIMNEIKNDAEASRLILPILDNKIISATINLSKQGDIEKVTLKDIDETFQEKKTRITLQFLKPTFKILETGSVEYNFNRLYFSVKDKKTLFNFQFDNFDFIQNRKDSLDNFSKMKIDNVAFSMNDKNEKLRVSLNDINTNYTINSEQDNVFFEEQLDLKKLNIVYNEKDKTSLNNLNFHFKVDQLDKRSLAQFINDYSINGGNFNHYSDKEINNLFKLINNGFNLSYEIKLDNLKTILPDSSNADMIANIKLNKNDLNQNNISPDKLISLLDIYTYLEIDTNTYENIKNLDEDYSKYLQLFYHIKEKDLYGIDFSVKDSKVTVSSLDFGNVAKYVGDIYFEKKDYPTAINWYKIAIKFNNYEAKFRLAYSYNKLENYDLAIVNYTELVKEIDPDRGDIERDNHQAAMYNLARIYLYGKKDYQKTIEWAKRAIENGYKGDYFSIAYSYDELKDYTNAEIWYKKSIEEDNKYAMWNLGLIYEYGKGEVQQDINKAIEMYEKALLLGFEDAKERLEKLKRTRKVEKNENENKKIISNESISKYNSKAIEKTMTFNENGIQINLTYPNSVKAGEAFTIRVEMTNINQNAKQGGLTLSFPDMQSIRGQVLNNDFSLLKGYSYPDKIYNKNTKRNMTANYFMVEGWEKNTWSYGKTKYFTVELIAPQNLKKLRVNARGVLWINSKNDLREIPMNSLFYDQQGFTVKQFSIEINQ